MESNINILQKNGFLRFEGRVCPEPYDGKIWFNWSGSGFEFSFNGSTASAYLYTDETVRGKGERAYIAVFADGSNFALARFPLDNPQGWYTLAEDLPFGKHIIRVVKETEVGYGRAAVLSLECDGEFSQLPHNIGPKIEFIGDSITCGYGNICSTESPEFVTREESFSNTFAAFTARMLDAAVYCVAASGNGFMHDYGCNTRNLIPELYLYTDKMLCENYGFEAEKWNFKENPVDAVVIKLGANDAQYCKGADLEESFRSPDILNERRRQFEKTAADFFKRLTVLRSGVPIFSVYETDMYLLHELEDAMRDAGSQIIPVPIAGKRSYEGVGANGHWSVCTHMRAAAVLCERMKKELCLP